MILYKKGHVLIDGSLVQTDIVANHGRIIEIAPDIVADEETEVIDCSNRYVLPALVDIHTHGAVGYDFNTADVEGLKKILELKEFPMMCAGIIIMKDQDMMERCLPLI